MIDHLIDHMIDFAFSLKRTDCFKVLDHFPHNDRSVFLTLCDRSYDRSIISMIDHVIDHMMIDQYDRSNHCMTHCDG